MKNIFRVLSGLEFKDIDPKDDITINIFGKTAFVYEQAEGKDPKVKDIDITIDRLSSNKFSNEVIVNMAAGILGLDIDGDVVTGYMLIHAIDKAKTELADRLFKKRMKNIIKWTTIIAAGICLVCLAIIFLK